jgi:hypothetical protein
VEQESRQGAAFIANLIKEAMRDFPDPKAGDRYGLLDVMTS